MLITGETRVAAVIGDPIRHSLSPVIHNAAFTALGLDWIYVALPVAAGNAAAAIEAMATLGLDGLSVTMPHKHDVAAAVDRRSPAVEVLGACNCVYRSDGELVGDNTDGPGFLASLVDAEVDVRGMSVAVLGAGGAARAIVQALGTAGVSRIAVVNRSERRGREAAELAPMASLESTAVVGDCDLIVNATSVGMGADVASDALPLPPAIMVSRHVVVDVVYQPTITPLLRAAKQVGATTIGGIGMLVHQAAVAFEHWTSVAAPIPVMRQAIDQTLGVESHQARPGVN